MTPSAARLLGLIRSRTAAGSYWTRLNLGELAAFMDLTVRTLARAKAELADMGLVRFRTISNGAGRGHKLHAAIVERLQGKRGELLHGDKRGRERHCWTRIGGNRVNRPAPRPHDIPLTIGNHRFHQESKPTPPKANLAKRGPSKRQQAFAHWLKRDLWARSWWDNCKIERSDAHLYGFALRSIVAGFDLDRVYRCFDAALRRLHGTATDVGLMRGNPTTVRFSLSSTVAAAERMLRRPVEPGIATGKTAPVAVGIGPGKRPTREPQRQQGSQSARILGIIDALA